MTRTAVAGVVGTLALTGCGGSGGAAADGPSADAEDTWAQQTSADDMLDNGIRLLERASSVALKLDGTSDGERLRGELVLIDERNCFGSLRIGTAPSFDLTIVDGVDYMRTSRAGWRSLVQSADSPVSAAQADEIAKLIGDRWVTTRQYDGFCNGFDVGDELTAGRKRGIASVGEMRGAEISVTFDGDPGTAVLDLAEPHHLLRIRTAQGTITLGDYGAATEAPLPSEGDRVDFASLGELNG